LRAKFEAATNPDIERSLLGINHRGFVLNRDKTLADATTLIQEQKELGLKSTDQKTKDEVVANVNRQYDNLASIGYITRDEAAQRKIAFQRDYTFTGFRMGTAADRFTVSRKADAAEMDDVTDMGWQMLRSNGWNGIATSAILGHVGGESGFDPRATHTEDDGSVSMGLIQWNKSRRRDLERFHNPWDAKTQYMFLMDEIDRLYPGLKERMNAAPNIVEAANLFAQVYVKPRGSNKGGYENIDGWGRRLATANAVAEKYGKGEVPVAANQQLWNKMDADLQLRVKDEATADFTSYLRQRSNDQKQEEYTVEQQRNSSLSSIENTGLDLPDKNTYEDIRRVAGQAKADEYAEDAKRAQRAYAALANKDQMTDGELYNAVESLRPTKPGMGFDEDMKLYQRKAQEVDRFIAARNADPATAVAHFPNVKQAYAQLEYNTLPDGTKTVDKFGLQNLIAQRLIAQKSVGIINPMPISTKEAIGLQHEMKRLAFDDNGLQSWMRQIFANYGQYGDDVINAVMMVGSGLDESRAVLVTQTFKSLMEADPNSFVNFRKYVETDMGNRLQDAMDGKQPPPVAPHPTWDSALHPLSTWGKAGKIGQVAATALANKAGIWGAGNNEKELQLLKTPVKKDMQWLLDNRNDENVKAYINMQYGGGTDVATGILKVWDKMHAKLPAEDPNRYSNSTPSKSLQYAPENIPAQAKPLQVPTQPALTNNLQSPVKEQPPKTVKSGGRTQINMGITKMAKDKK
jgi:hypothetical protein